MAHKWIMQSKGFGHTTSKCAECGMERTQRHSAGFHWTEWKINGEFIDSKKTPPCEAEHAST